MKSPRVSIGLLVLLVLAGGCASSLNNRAPYSGYLKRPLALQEDAHLVATEAWTGGNIDQIFFPPHAVFILVRESDSLLKYAVDQKREMIALPSGTPLRLTKVIDRVTGGGAQIEAQGEIFVAAKNSYVPFLYIWGYQCDKYLKRAPWEGADIKESDRPLSYGGCS